MLLPTCCWLLPHLQQCVICWLGQAVSCANRHNEAGTHEVAECQAGIVWSVPVCTCCLQPTYNITLQPTPACRTTIYHPGWLTRLSLSVSDAYCCRPAARRLAPQKRHPVTSPTRCAHTPSSRSAMLAVFCHQHHAVWQLHHDFARCYVLCCQHSPPCAGQDACLALGPQQLVLLAPGNELGGVWGLAGASYGAFFDGSWVCHVGCCSCDSCQGGGVLSRVADLLLELWGVLCQVL